ncbi:uncharacterized protein SCHCODRAFT_02639920 [Schizophyllum commune H4-8]|uniref:uncharacterized protein n=1 Tax=Schizophyllum commune (strain H4-8 / FGSC 9210) TaxID=578458 RepID=UPI00215E90C2|nr:uncharacterized protein SCHCODRAFT_02639920 [Schizophyllum commune H4-8]KAI5886828.1 hypothetical protein SCHCODRAFT_02639920 [Schizophyllum commune H4-8]
MGNGEGAHSRASRVPSLLSKALLGIRFRPPPRSHSLRRPLFFAVPFLHFHPRALLHSACSSTPPLPDAENEMIPFPV